MAADDCTCPMSVQDRVRAGGDHSTSCPLVGRCPACGARLDPVRGGCLPCFVAEHARGARLEVPRG